MIGNASTAWISEQLHAQAAGDPTPFFVYLAPHAPHTAPNGQSMVAPWYKHTLPGIKAPRTASFGVAAPDHHWYATTALTLLSGSPATSWTAGSWRRSRR